MLFPGISIGCVLQTAHQSALAERSGLPKPTRKEEVGVTHSGLQQVDTHTPNPASLSTRPLQRHSLFIRAVCVDAHVRIRPGGALSDERPYRDH